MKCNHILDLSSTNGISGTIYSTEREGDVPELDGPSTYQRHQAASRPSSQRSNGYHQDDIAVGSGICAPPGYSGGGDPAP